MFNTDSATITGIKHSKSALSNQDYGLTGAVDSMSYLVVSDGCSTGGRTDLGARLLALSAQKAIISESFNPLLFKSAILDLLKPNCGILPQEDWLATLGVAVLRDNHMLVSFLGDGHIILRHKNGNITLINLEYTENKPHYIAYDLFNYRIPASDNKLVISTIVISGMEDILSSQSNEYEDVKPYCDVFNLEDVDFVAISTDGLGTTSLPLNTMAKEMCAIKSPTGDFMKRRVSWAMRSLTQQPMDDFTIAAAIRSASNE
jgi:hypothetical protein